MKSLQRLLFLVKVEGMSSWPHLIPHTYYVASKLIPPRIGDFVVFRHPHHKTLLVKKVVSRENGMYRVSGTLPRATSSETLGLIAPHQIEGKILFAAPAS
jgi:hypothetical protein